MRDQGFLVEAAQSPAEVASRCHLVVTATASSEPLLRWSDIRPGTHITAIGADSADKQELDPAIIQRSDLVVTDSRIQGRSRGELWHAYRVDDAGMSRIVEIGEVVSGTVNGRTAAEQVTVSTFSGLAVQDIAIASAVLDRS